MHVRPRQLLLLSALGALLPSGVASASAAQRHLGRGDWHHPSSYLVATILSGSSLEHQYTVGGSTTVESESLSSPDDITRLGDDLFVGFQNGVGPQGQPSADGNGDSTVVEFTTTGRVVAQWDVVGKADGVTADPRAGDVVVTVNEDANSSLYTIDPGSPGIVTHYAYSMPLPHDGGTDAISVEGRRLFISASAPGTTGTAAPQASYPAVYSVTLDAATSVAVVAPLFFDEDAATDVTVGSPGFGSTAPVALTDPDSNENVPRDAVRFAGDFMLTSQGDEQQIFIHNPGSTHQHLDVLDLTASVDDTAWPTDDRGTLYSTDSTDDTVDAVTGRFPVGSPLAVVTPCGENSAPATCPAPGYPTNYLATLNPYTGALTPVTTTGATYVPQGGLVYVGSFRP